jgi:hypothetical protein
LINIPGLYGIRKPDCPGIMKQLKIPALLANNCRRPLSFVLIWISIFFTIPGFGQKADGWLLDKMPTDLETDFALSALPAHLRDSATVYLLDPEKGYYMARKGTNGFSTYVERTDWARSEFVPDTYGAISYDAEGSKIYLPVAFAVAEMRASGKFSPKQIVDTIVKRVKAGIYKAPSRTGVSYMLGPILRTHQPDGKIVNMVMPHFMFYAPRVDNADIGGVWDGHTPYAIGAGNVLDKEHSIFNFIIIPAGDAEKAAIVESNIELIRRLGEYKACLKIEPGAGNHQH